MYSMLSTMSRWKDFIVEISDFMESMGYKQKWTKVNPFRTPEWPKRLSFKSN